ncbi:MAG TPA: phosphotransferase, partial [Anaerolineales bacterium]|nr:phosphotransferase [Anaerolineales bacterium]
FENGLMIGMLEPRRWVSLIFLLSALMVYVATACQQAAPAQEVVKTVAVTGEVAQEREATKTEAAEPPAPPTLGPIVPTTPEPVEPTAIPTPLSEQRTVELEWPPQMRLGDSDVVRLSLIPTEGGYKLQADYPEHRTDSKDIHVSRPGGYELIAAARLDGVGFEISPQGERQLFLPVGGGVTWFWSITPRAPGQQRLSIVLYLRWLPATASQGIVRESVVYTRSLDVQVRSFFGLTRGQAMTGGLLGVLLGGGLGLLSLLPLRRLERSRLLVGGKPNAYLVIEPHPDLTLHKEEDVLLRTLFNRYSRLVLESEFLSGYSGARSFLALPIRPDGRADAYTIVKVGPTQTVQQEYSNYETFVKDTLPPITARIQRPPVRLPKGEISALQYTFIAEPGRMPTSLRQALLEHPDPALIMKVFEIFGPNWWMQRKPYTFRLSQEYDRLLPAHYVVEPGQGKGAPLHGRMSPAEAVYSRGEIASLGRFADVQAHSDGRSLSLKGETSPGQPPLRVRWLSREDPNGRSGRVVATRWTILHELTAGFNRYELPDPISRLPDLLEQTISATQSTIHGDLNLENVLVGPGDFVWLIDFASTREGHPLFDFARLQAEIIAHVIARRLDSPEAHARLLREGANTQEAELHALLEMVETIASRCLFNPMERREYYLAAYLACLGALKFTNLEPRQKHLLYLTAAHYCQKLD